MTRMKLAGVAIMVISAVSPLPAQSTVRAKRDGILINQSDKNGVSVRRGNEPVVQGSGNVVRQQRRAGKFSTIKMSGPAHLDVVVGKAASVELSADDNLMPMLETRIENGALVHEVKGSFSTRTTPRLRVTVPQLSGVHLAASGDVRITGVNGGRLNLTSNGSGDFVVQGHADALKAQLNGSGNFDLTRFRAPDLTVAIYGSGNARVHATERLDASIFGAGEIAYSGDPQRLNRQVYGSGRITKVGR